MQRLRAIYLTRRLIVALAVVAVLFVFGHFWTPLATIAWIGLGVIGLALVLETAILLRPAVGVTVERNVPRRFSNGDWNEVVVTMENHTGGGLRAEVIEELPVQFQARTYRFAEDLEPGARRRVAYTVRPTQRGRYRFGHVNVYVSTAIGLVQRRYRSEEAHEAAVFPSFLQLERYQLVAATSRLELIGLKKMRRLGHTMEFEHVREYATGDDVRTLNWRATARRGGLMVNQYQDERAQPIYAVIDLGRTMRMPFDELTLLDHSLNAALVLAGVALKKGDMAGLVTYSDRVHTFLRAERRSGQMGRILEALYAVETNFSESDSQRLYTALRRDLPRRSLLIVFTNFESVSGMRRHLPQLSRLADRHVVLCILFENTELRHLAGQPADRLDTLYVQTIARQFTEEKREIARILRQHGVGTLFTTPGDLTLNVINRYLELKAQGVI